MTASNEGNIMNYDTWLQNDLDDDGQEEHTGKCNCGCQECVNDRIYWEGADYE